MFKFLKRLFRSDSSIHELDKRLLDEERAVDDDYARKCDEEARLRRERWEVKNAMAKKRDAANLYLKKTAFESYEQYQASQQKNGLNQLAQYANMQAQMNMNNYHGQNGLYGPNLIRGIFG